MKERDFCPLYEKRCSALMRVRSFSPILNVRELIGRASSIGISQRVISWKNRFHFVRMTWRLNDCNHFSILFPYFWFFLLFCSQTELPRTFWTVYQKPLRTYFILYDSFESRSAFLSLEIQSKIDAANSWEEIIRRALALDSLQSNWMRKTCHGYFARRRFANISISS